MFEAAVSSRHCSVLVSGVHRCLTGEHVQSNHGDGPEAGISLQRYQEVLKEAMAEASDEEEDPAVAVVPGGGIAAQPVAGSHEAACDPGPYTAYESEDPAVAPGGGIAAQPVAGLHEAAGGPGPCTACVSVVVAESASSLSGRASEDAGSGVSAAVCEDAPDAFGNVTFAPPSESSGDEDPGRGTKGMGAGGDGCVPDEAEKVATEQSGGLSSAAAAQGGGAAKMATAKSAGRVESTAGGVDTAAQGRVRRQRTELQQLLASVPLPAQAPDRKHVLLLGGLPGLGAEEDNAPRREGRRVPGRRQGGCAEAVASALAMAHAGAGEENHAQVRRRATRAALCLALFPAVGQNSLQLCNGADPECACLWFPAVCS